MALPQGRGLAPGKGSVSKRGTLPGAAGALTAALSAKEGGNTMFLALGSCLPALVPH